jgi:hypothetical protein
MAENQNILRCEHSEVYNILNERQVNSRRFAATTEKEVDELVSNAQAHSTKAKTIYAVNILKVHDSLFLKQQHSHLQAK